MASLKRFQGWVNGLGKTRWFSIAGLLVAIVLQSAPAFAQTTASYADARRKLETLLQERMQALTGGLSLPPGLKLF